MNLINLLNIIEKDRSIRIRLLNKNGDFDDICYKSSSFVPEKILDLKILNLAPEDEQFFICCDNPDNIVVNDPPYYEEIEKSLMQFMLHKMTKEEFELLKMVVNKVLDDNVIIIDSE